MKSKWIVVALALCTAACMRKVSVDEPQPVGSNANAPASTGGGNASSPNGGGQAGAPAPSAGPPSSSAPMGGTDSSASSPSNTGGQGSADTAGPSTTDTAMQGVLMSGIDQAKHDKSSKTPSAIEQVEALVTSLANTDVPAVSSGGVSLMQYSKANEPAVLYVEWSGAAHWYYKTDHAYHLYTASSGDHRLSLLDTMTTYGVYEDGATAELSGTPNEYKELLAANAQGFAWIDYANVIPSQVANFFGVNSFGAVVYQTYDGSRTTLTDDQRFRERIDLSDQYVVYVEYANKMSNGQIMVQPLAGGAAMAAAPSANHQDRPAIDGEWVVWEEYLNDTDAVIRARNLTTGEMRDLSSKQGFRTNPDVLGTRVVWEDQRSGDSDIYYADLATNDGEHIAVSGSGYSTAARLASDGLVWIEISGKSMGLMRASWTSP